ncbi:NACHT domain-containing NTPase [Clostridium sp. BSD9I1]|uniref:NACHT domain-containing protein n=1 Tax=Clostridium sp. BSD9I1 TaxID=2003589 RepID=UPI0016479495|nr:NACHT domain-containing protein [Clostridium sp. BSD9I1]
MTKIKQEQKGSIGSTNIQIANLIIKNSSGDSHIDEICIDIDTNELIKLQTEEQRKTSKDSTHGLNHSVYESLKGVLRKYYLNNYKKIDRTMGGSINTENLSFNLIDRKAPEKEKSTKYEIVNSILLKDILQLSKGKALILGDPGIGKTTLCKFILQQWSVGDLWESSIVIYLQLKEWNEKSEDFKTLGDFILEKYSKFKEKELDYLLSSDNVIFIFDGLNEILSKNKKNFFDKLSMENLHNCIFTSQSYDYDELIKKDYEIFENIGLKKENIKQYLEDYFNYKEPFANNISNDIMNINVDLTKNPMLLDMICFLKGKDEYTKTETITEIYEGLLEKYIEIYIEDEKEFDLPDSGKFISIISELSYKSLISSRSYITGREFSEFLNESKMEYSKKKNFFNDKFLNVGFFRAKYPNRQWRENKYEFFHSTFQEFLTAKHIVSKFDETSLIKFLDEYKYEKRFEQVFRFLFGILSINSEDRKLNILFDNLLNNGVDIIGFEYLLLILKCLHDVEQEKINCIGTISSILKRWINFLLKDMTIDSLRFANHFRKIANLVKSSKQASKLIINALNEYSNDESKLIQFISIEILYLLGEKDNGINLIAVEVIEDYKEDINFKCYVLETIGRLKIFDSNIKCMFENLIEEDCFEVILVDILESLIRLGEVYDEANEIAIEILFSDIDWVREEAIKALFEEEIQNTNLKRLVVDYIDDSGDEDDLDTQTAIEILLKIGINNEEAEILNEKLTNLMNNTSSIILKHKVLKAISEFNLEQCDDEKFYRDILISITGILDLVASYSNNTDIEEDIVVGEGISALETFRKIRNEDGNYSDFYSFLIKYIPYYSIKKQIICDMIDLNYINDVIIEEIKNSLIESDLDAEEFGAYSAAKLFQYGNFNREIADAIASLWIKLDKDNSNKDHLKDQIVKYIYKCILSNEEFYNYIKEYEKINPELLITESMVAFIYTNIEMLSSDFFSAYTINVLHEAGVNDLDLVKKLNQYYLKNYNKKQIKSVASYVKVATEELIKVYLSNPSNKLLQLIFYKALENSTVIYQGEDNLLHILEFGDESVVEVGENEKNTIIEMFNNFREI